MVASQHVMDVNADQFEAEVVERSKRQPVVVDFWAPWCGPCRVLGPTLEALADEAAGAWVLAKVNVDQNQGLAGQFGVRGIPAVKAFVDGKIVDEFTGALPRQRIEAWLEGVVPDEAAQARDEAVAEAMAAEQAGDLEAAQAAWRRVLRDEPDHAKAASRLALIEADRGLVAEARELLERVPGGEMTDEPDYHRAWFAIEAAAYPERETLAARVDEAPDDLEARFGLGARLIAAGDFDRGLEQLLEIVARDRSWRDDRGREAMVRAFKILDDPERVRHWQRRMGQAMY